MSNNGARVSLYDRIAGLDLEIDAVSLEPLRIDTGRFDRRTTVVRLRGAGLDGAGEDVGYTAADQQSFQERGVPDGLTGRFTFAGFAARLDDFALAAEPLAGGTDRMYRRWAFESAAVDLALRQAGLSLAGLLDRPLQPVRFVLSGGLGEPASLAPLQRRLERYPDARFKIDFSSSWTPAIVGQLAELDCIEVVDLKGLYRGAFQGPPADAAMYRTVAEGLPGVRIEDPEWNPATAAALAPHRQRISWDANLHALNDLIQLPFKPTVVNMKPSRFGSVAELLRTYEYCEAHGIATYGGGQFELGPGRGQLQYLAAMFHGDASNDVAPVGYHAPSLPVGLPTSPLAPPADPVGFRWID